MLILTLQLNLILQHSTDIRCVIFVTCTFLDSCLYEYQIHLFRIDLVLTCQELLESQSIKKLFDILHIYHWHAIQKSETLYPNGLETLLPKWYKGGKNEWELVSSSKDKN